MVEHMDGVSRSAIQKIIDAGCITVNGKMVTSHHFLKSGDKIEARNEHEEREEKRKYGGAELKAKRDESSRPTVLQSYRPTDLLIIKETPSWIVVYKPCDVLMHPDHDHADGTLIDAVMAHAPEVAKIGEDPSRPGIVSRLDKDVSGLVVIAKTHEAFENLKKQFAEHSVKKIYTALVHDDMERDEGEIKFRIARSSTKARMSAIPETSTSGQAAWTHYQVEKRYQGATLLTLQIMSGRTHQIRAHLFAIQHPIVGDALYAMKSTIRNIASPRLMLQSTSLSFIDPSTGERELFEIPLDDDFQNVINSL